MHSFSLCVVPFRTRMQKITSSAPMVFCVVGNMPIALACTHARPHPTGYYAHWGQRHAVGPTVVSPPPHGICHSLQSTREKKKKNLSSRAIKARCSPRRKISPPSPSLSLSLSLSLSAFPPPTALERRWGGRPTLYGKLYRLWVCIRVSVCVSLIEPRPGTWSRVYTHTHTHTQKDVVAPPIAPIDFSTRGSAVLNSPDFREAVAKQILVFLKFNKVFAKFQSSSA